jgi:hypothetical protein
MDSLRARLDEFKKAFESGAPPYNAPREAIEPVHRATAELKGSGIERRALKHRAPTEELRWVEKSAPPPAVELTCSRPHSSGRREPCQLSLYPLQHNRTSICSLSSVPSSLADFFRLRTCGEPSVCMKLRLPTYALI